MAKTVSIASLVLSKIKVIVYKDVNYSWGITSTIVLFYNLINVHTEMILILFNVHTHAHRRPQRITELSFFN